MWRSVNDRVQVVALGASVALLLVVLELVRRRRLSEEYSPLWILAALALIAASIRSDVLDQAAQWLNRDYPPVVLLLPVALLAFAVALCFSVILSRQQREIDRLTEETAILSAELRDMRASLQGAHRPAFEPDEIRPAIVNRDQLGRTPADRFAGEFEAERSGPNLPAR
jgi:hypothetical protein